MRHRSSLIEYFSCDCTGSCVHRTSSPESLFIDWQRPRLYTGTCWKTVGGGVAICGKSSESHTQMLYPSMAFVTIHSRQGRHTLPCRSLRSRLSKERGSSLLTNVIYSFLFPQKTSMNWRCKSREYEDRDTTYARIPALSLPSGYVYGALDSSLARFCMYAVSGDEAGNGRHAACL